MALYKALKTFVTKDFSAISGNNVDVKDKELAKVLIKAEYIKELNKSDKKEKEKEINPTPFNSDLDNHTHEEAQEEIEAESNQELNKKSVK